MIILNVTKIKNSVTAVRGMSNIPSTLRDTAINLGLARMVAYATALPTSPVANPVAVYKENAVEALKALAAVNENTVINMPVIMTAAMTIWRARYDMVFSGYSRDSLALCKAVTADTAGFNFDAEMAKALEVAQDSDALGANVDLAIGMFTPGVVMDEDEDA